MSEQNVHTGMLGNSKKLKLLGYPQLFIDDYLLKFTNKIITSEENQRIDNIIKNNIKYSDNKELQDVYQNIIKANNVKSGEGAPTTPPINQLPQNNINKYMIYIIGAIILIFIIMKKKKSNDTK